MGTCTTCGAEGKIHRHHIASDLYFMARGLSSKEDYLKYEGCAPLCEPCHRLITMVNARFRKVYLKGIDAWKMRKRTPRIYAELKQEMATTVWQRFLKDSSMLTTRADCNQLGKKLALLAIDKNYGR